MNEVDEIKRQLALARQERERWHGAHNDHRRAACRQAELLERRLRRLESLTTTRGNDDATETF